MLTKLVPLPFWKEAIAPVWVEVALTMKVGVVEGPAKFWTYSKAVGEVVPKPILLPLSNSKELAVVEAPVYLTRKLLVPEPLNLLLKVKKSEPWS